MLPCRQQRPGLLRSAAAVQPQHSRHDEAESHLRQAGRLLELVGVADIEAARMARIVFRLAQRVAVDGGRLERAA